MNQYKVSWFNYLNKVNKRNLIKSDYYKNISSISDYQLLVAKDDSVARKIFTVFPNPLILYEYQMNLDEKDRNMYEIIPGDKPQKIHFDVDIGKEDIKYFNENDFLNDIVDSLKKFTKVNLNLEKDILIFTSHGKEKMSYHIILDNYFLRNHHETKQFVKMILCEYPRLTRFVDSVIYTSNRQFRLFGNCKLGTQRFKVLMNEWKYKNQIIKYHSQDDKIIFLNSLVSNTLNCKLLDLFEEVVVVVEKKETIKTDRSILNDIIDMYSKKFGNDIPFDFDNIDGGLITTKRIKPSFCDICNREHEHENPYFTINKLGDVLYCCRRSNSLVKIGNIRIEDELIEEKIDEKEQQDEKSDEVDSLEQLIRNQLIINQQEENAKKNKIKSKDFFTDRKRLLGEMFSE